MTTRIYFATNQIGDVSFSSLQEALHEFDLGILEEYKQTEKGVMGQTLLIRTSQGSIF